MVAIGLFFEDASEQSKMQRTITNIFGVFFFLIILNYIFWDWIWLTVITPFVLGLFILAFLMFGLGKGKKEKKPDA